MRKLNVKFLLCLLASVVLFGGGVVLAHSLQFKRIPLALLKQAGKAEGEGDLRRAIGYLDRYLVFVPNDGEQRARIALLLADPKVAVGLKARGNAFAALDKALTYDAGRHDLRRLAVPLAIELRRLEKANEYLLQLPADGERAGLWGKWYEAKEAFPDAVKAYREAVKLSPSKIENYVRLAGLLAEGRGDPTRRLTPSEFEAENREADRVMATLVAKNPKSWEAFIARWNFRRNLCLRQPRQDIRSTLLKGVFNLLTRAASADVTRALELAEGELDVRLAAAELAQLEDNLDAARSHLDKAMQLHRKDPRIYRAFAGLELQVEEKLKGPEEKKRARARAQGWLRQGVEQLVPPAQLDVLWSHATLLIDSGNPAELKEANEVIEKIRAANFQPAGVDFLLGRLLVVRQQWAEAAKLLERARPKLANATDLANQIDVLLARCFSELDDKPQALATYERLSQRNPTSAAAKYGLALSARRAGNLKKALEEFGQLVRLDDAPAGVWAEMMRLQIVNARQSGSSENWQNIENALAVADKTSHADKAEVAILRAEALVAREQPDKAREALEKAQAANPQRVELWTALAGLEERLRNPEQALKVLERAAPRFTASADQVELRLALARHWADQRGEKARTELKKLENGLNHYTETERNYLLNGLAEAHYRASNFAEAARLWRDLAAQEQYRNDLSLRLVLFDLALQEDRPDEMDATLRDIGRLEGGDGTFYRHAQALRLVWRVKRGKTADAKEKDELLERALTLLTQVQNARPSWPVPLLTEAEIETLRGNPDRVIACYEKALKSGERNPVVIRQLVETYRKQGKLKDAERVLSTLDRKDLLRGELAHLVALIEIDQGNTAKGIGEALNAVRNDSRDYRDHLWLGGLLARGGEVYANRAEEHLRRAVLLAPAEPDPYVALVSFLAGKKTRAGEAEQVLADVRAKVPPKQLALTLARCFGQLRKENDARKSYEAALQANPDDPAVLKDYAGFYLQREQFKEAEPLLRRLVDGKLKLSEEDAQWGHSRLAMLLAAGTDIARFKEALLHVGLKMQDDGTFARDTRLVSAETVEMRRFAARVLASQQQWRCRDEAFKRLEELSRRQALTADDRFILARLYEARRDWSGALNQLAEIAGLEDRRPNHLVAYAQTLLRYDRKDEARKQIERLGRMQTDRADPAIQVDLVDLQARWYEVNGQGAKAEQVLTEFLNRSGSKPQEILILVASLARQQKFDKALGLLDRVWKTCPPEIAGATSVALLRSTRASAEQQADVVRRLEEAKKKEPRNTNLIVQLGDVKDIQNDWEKAEPIYREALAIDPNDVLALNNLAWLVAQRTKNGEKALELVNRAIALVGPRGELLDTRAMAYLALEKPAEAIQDLQEAVQETLTPTRCFHLARAYHQAKKRDAAARELQRAKDLGLQASQLHPVEHQEYNAMVKEYQR